MRFECLARSVLVKPSFWMLAGLGLLISPVQVWPWGCDGHQAVAMIAEKHLSSHALQTANKLLQDNPIDPALSRYCPNQGLDLMSDSSTWPDDIRKDRPEASPWHYIDIPRGASFSAIAESCPASTGCVTAAIQHQLDLLHNEGAAPHERADALRFVTHFVGDIHQPLHCISNNDEGGNCLPVDFFGNATVEKNPQFESYSPNLHSVWDSFIIQRLRGTQSVAQWADSLDGQFSSHDKAWRQEGINLDAWAWEGHELAESIAYDKLPVAVAVEKPVPVKSCADDNHVSTRLLQLHEQLVSCPRNK